MSDNSMLAEGPGESLPTDDAEEVEETEPETEPEPDPET